MTRTIALMSAMGLMLFLGACGKENVVTSEEFVANEQAATEEYNLVGTWTQTDAEGDSVLVLTLNEDGSGSLMTEPEDIGVPLDYEIDGTSIMTHMGSVDDNTEMEYLPESDQILYNGMHFAR